MATIERTEGREEECPSPREPSYSLSKKRGARPKSAPKSAKKSPHPKLKNYLLHYRKGKYYLVNLDLKKRGHDQKYV